MTSDGAPPVVPEGDPAGGPAGDPAGGPAGDPAEAWAALGDEGGVTVEAVELHQVELAFRAEVRTSRGVHRSRPVVLVHLVGRRGAEPVDGWGECAALVDTTFDAEDAAIAFATLERTLVPRLLSACRGSGGLVPLSALPAAVGPEPGRPLSYAALEMAVADAHLRGAGRSFADLVGAAAGPLAAGAVVGQHPDEEELLRSVARLVEAGFTRVKLKIGPGADLGPVGAVRGRYPGLLLQVDANESYAGTDADLEHLAGLDPFGLLCVEQPFGRRDLAAHARLADRIATPVCLDESLTSPAAVTGALDGGACSVVCVKPSRLGGIAAALAVVGECRARGVPMWMGGMFESGYARQVNVALAALEGFSWPGDLSGPDGYLVEDLVTPAGAGAAVAPGTPPGRGRAEAVVARLPGFGWPPDPCGGGSPDQPVGAAGRAPVTGPGPSVDRGRPAVRRIAGPCIARPWNAASTTPTSGWCAPGTNWRCWTSSWPWSTTSPTTPGSRPWWRKLR